MERYTKETKKKKTSLEGHTNNFYTGIHHDTQELV